MSIEYSKKAIKAIKSINEPYRGRILKAIKKIPSGDIKQMKNYDNAYRLRVGKYRIIYYNIDTHTILIDEIGLRGQIYKNK